MPFSEEQKKRKIIKLEVIADEEKTQMVECTDETGEEWIFRVPTGIATLGFYETIEKVGKNGRD